MGLILTGIEGILALPESYFQLLNSIVWEFQIPLKGHLNLSHVLLELHQGTAALSPGGLWSHNLNLDFPLPWCVFLGFNWLSPLRRPGSQWDADEGLCHLSPALLECHQRQTGLIGVTGTDSDGALCCLMVQQTRSDPPHKIHHTKSRGFETSGCSQLFLQSHPCVPIPDQNNTTQQPPACPFVKLSLQLLY